MISTEVRNRGRGTTRERFVGGYREKGTDEIFKEEYYSLEIIWKDE